MYANDLIVTSRASSLLHLFEKIRSDSRISRFEREMFYVLQV